VWTAHAALVQDTAPGLGPWLRARVDHSIANMEGRARNPLTILPLPGVPRLSSVSMVPCQEIAALQPFTSGSAVPPGPAEPGRECLQPPKSAPDSASPSSQDRRP
jgi:hypothetical protein